MSDMLTNNPNWLTYKELAGIKLGDLYEYQNRIGQTCHYVVSFLHKRMETPIATIVYADGYSESLGAECLNSDKRIGNIDWWTIHDKYIDEANRYIGAEE